MAAARVSPLFCFTLDTEPDDLWANRPSLSFDHFGRLLDFHHELTDRGARPTYLTTSEVAEHRPAARVMEQILDTGRAEVGAHFHTWTRSWKYAIPDLGNPPLHACAHQLGQEAEEHMLACTCSSLELNLGVRPTSYRGGRWSFNEASVRSLRNCGIRVDSTMTPGISWVDASHPLKSGPDFRDAPRHPHHLADELLEIPVGTSFHPDRERALRRGLLSKIGRRVRRLVGLPAGVLWLRPTTMSRQQMRFCLGQLANEGITVWVAMIHSSEIGLNSYFPTEEKVSAFRSRCLGLVEDAMSLGATGATLDEVRLRYQETRTPLLEAA
jgi:hypothetical protein